MATLYLPLHSDVPKVSRCDMNDYGTMNDHYASKDLIGIENHVEIDEMAHLVFKGVPDPIFSSITGKIYYWQTLLRQSCPTSGFLQLLNHRIIDVRIAVCNLLLIIADKKVSDPKILDYFRQNIRRLHEYFPDKTNQLGVIEDIMKADSIEVDAGKYSLSIGRLHHLFNDGPAEVDGTSLPTVEAWEKSDRYGRQFIVRLAIGYEQYLRYQSTTRSPFAYFAGDPLIQNIEETRRAEFINLARWWHCCKSEDKKLQLGRQRFEKLASQEKVTKFGLVVLKAADTTAKRLEFRQRYAIHIP